MNNQSSRERLNAALHRQETDYVPLSLDMHPSYHTGPVGSAKNQFEVIEALQELGTDPTVDIWFPVQAHHPDVKTAYWREKSPDGQGFLRCRRYETPAGILQQKVKETPELGLP